MADNEQILDAAIEIRTQREVGKAVHDYVGSMRLALEDVQSSNVEMVRRLRDEMVELQQKNAEALLSLTEGISELVAAIAAIEPLVVNVPETILQLEQQPVNINLPRSVVQSKPVINLPEPTVVIDRQESQLPKSLRINHSDGSRSTIEFLPVPVK